MPRQSPASDIPHVAGAERVRETRRLDGNIAFLLLIETDVRGDAAGSRARKRINAVPMRPT